MDGREDCYAARILNGKTGWQRELYFTQYENASTINDGECLTRWWYNIDPMLRISGIAAVPELALL